MSERTTESSVQSTPASSTPMHENARECTVSAERDFSPPQLNTRTLTQKHRAALDMLAAGKSDSEVCYALKIDASTLYRWKHNNPIFVAELNRRHQELWNDLAADLRLTVGKAIRTIDLQLRCANDLARLRAARTLIQLIKADRLSPENAPTHIDDILDMLLRRQQPKAAPKSGQDTPTFTPAQRQALFDQLMAQDAQAEAEEQAATAAADRNRTSATTAANQPPTPDAP